MHLKGRIGSSSISMGMDDYILLLKTRQASDSKQDREALDLIIKLFGED